MRQRYGREPTCYGHGGDIFCTFAPSLWSWWWKTRRQRTIQDVARCFFATLPARIASMLNHKGKREAMTNSMLEKGAKVVFGLVACSLVPVAGFAQKSSGIQDEIVVTARKREESLLEIPVAVSTLDQDQIIERSIIDTESLSAYHAWLRHSRTSARVAPRDATVRTSAFAVSACRLKSQRPRRSNLLGRRLHFGWRWRAST